MSMKFKKADDQVIYLPMNINCNKFHTVVGEDGFIEKLICSVRKRKTECKTCSLNRIRNNL